MTSTELNNLIEITFKALPDPMRSADVQLLAQLEMAYHMARQSEQMDRFHAKMIEWHEPPPKPKPKHPCSVENCERFGQFSYCGIWICYHHMLEICITGKSGKYPEPGTANGSDGAQEPDAGGAKA